MKKSVAAAAIAGSMMVGGGIGVALFAPGLAGADTTPTTTAPATPGSAATPAAPGATNQGNEDGTHEASETPEREAAEKNGTAFGPGGPHVGAHGSNETDAHEKAEDPAREAQEDANKAATTTTITAPA